MTLQEQTEDRPPNARVAAKARTLSLVTDTARDLFENSGPNGYEETTIRDIAAAMKRSTGSVFAVYPAGKAELYEAIYGHVPIPVQLGRELLLTLRDLTRPGVAMTEEAIDAAREAVICLWPTAFDQETRQ